MLEAQNAVLRTVVGDVINGHVRLINCGVTELRSLPFAGGNIDWNAYLKAYIEELAAAEKQASESPVPILATVDEDKPIEFGGDQ